MSEFARVRDPESGHEFSMAKAAVPDSFEVLDEDAVDTNGSPLPPKYAAPKEVTKMTVPELLQYAQDNDIDLGEATKKSDVLAAIQSAPTSQEG